MTAAPKLMTAILMAAVRVIGGCSGKPSGAPRVVHVQAAEDAPPVQWAGNDPEMEAAERRAQETLPVFWRVYDSKAADAGSYYLVKAPFRTRQGGQEHLWLVVLGRQGDQVTGIVINAPEAVPDIHEQDRVVVKASQISDWSYDRNGRKYGNFTTRVMIKRATPAVAAEYGADLAPTPLEGGER